MTAVCVVCGPTFIKVKGAGVRCRTRHNEKRRQSYRQKGWAKFLQNRYGIALEEWESLLISQSGRCAICCKPMRDPYLDHCHDTGRWRGLLCPSCNTAIGLFGDSPQRLRAALTYLLS